jgi:hypothetical protein
LSELKINLPRHGTLNFNFSISGDFVMYRHLSFNNRNPSGQLNTTVTISVAVYFTYILLRIVNIFLIFICENILKYQQVADTLKF